MRTKTLLLSAVIGAAGIASAMAQTVYSVNIVGYINLVLPPRLSMIANQLDATPDNTLPNVLGTPADINLSIFKFDVAAQTFVVSELTDGAWSVPGMTLAPGEGAFVDNAVLNGGNVNITLVGQVRLNSSVPFTSAFRIVSSVIPQAGPVSTLGLVPPGQFTIYKYEGATPETKSFKAYVFDDGWATEPSVAIGESVFTDNPPLTGPWSWDRTFVVGP